MYTITQIDKGDDIMKKIICLFLAVTMCFGLVACASSEASTPLHKVVGNKEADTEINKELSKNEPTENQSDATQVTTNAPEVSTPDNNDGANSESEAETENGATSDVENEKEKSKAKKPASQKPEKQDTYKFDAKVLKIYETKLLVEPVVKSQELECADKIYVSIKGISLPVHLRVDDYIRITYDGVILTTSPAQINTVYEIVRYSSTYLPPIDSVVITPMETFESHVLYANWTDDQSIVAGSINQFSNYPIYKFDTKEDVANFRASFSHLLNFGAFNNVVGAYSDEFFAENSVVLAYVTSGSGSTQFSVSYVDCNDTSVQIAISSESPDIGTCDMAGWFIVVIMPKDRIEGCTSFSAYIANSPQKVIYDKKF